MSSTERRVASFWERVFASSAPAVSGLAVLRILTGLYLLLFSAPYLTWVNRAPPAFYNPPLLSLGRLLPSFPAPWACWALEAALLVACAALALGIYARRTTLLLLALWLVRGNISYSFGKIDHDIMLGVLLGCMAFSGWGKELALVPDRPSRFDVPRRAFALLAVCLAFAMTSVGIQKGLNWLDFDTNTSGFLGWFVTGYFEYNRRALLAPYVLDLSPPLLELVDYMGVLFEASCLFMLLRGRIWWRFWLVWACTFHLLNTLTLNIPFFENFMVYLAFVDFSRVQARLEVWWRSTAFKVLVVTIVAAMPLVHLALRALGRGHAFLFVIDRAGGSLTVLYVAAVCWAVAATRLFGELLDQRRRAGAG
jgi:hypothetical protein